MLAFFSWLCGMVSAGIFAFLVYRASLLHRRARNIELNVKKAPPTITSGFLDKFSKRLKIEAGWRPIDHRLITLAILLWLSISY